MSGEIKELTLREALKRARATGALPSSSYEWYRKEAASTGKVDIAGKNVRAIKRRAWMLNAEDFKAALAAARSQRQALHQVDKDYKAGKLRPGGAHTSWGGYSVRGNFHFVWSDEDRVRHKSDGAWICNRCWKAASLEHNKPECHRCSDWSGCGTDCTLSRIYCEACGTSMMA